MTTRLTQEALERHLWSAADILRGSIDSSDSKKYILSLLFLKRLSDRFEEESETVRAEGGNPEDPDEHQFHVPPVARWQRLEKVVLNIGEELNKAMAALEQSNPKLEGILYSLDFNDGYKLGGIRQRDQILGNLVHLFSGIDLRNANLSEAGILGRACEYLIARFAGDPGRGGEFFTPHALSRLMVEILQPREGLRICDPACGSGGLLIQCADYIQRQGGNPRNLSLYGQEKNLETWTLSKMNMLLNELEHEIKKGDLIRDPKLLEHGELMLFDITLSNPPMSVSNWGIDVAAHDPWRRFRFGMPPPGNGDFAFIQHMIATLTPGGRMAALIAQGILFRGRSEADIRRQLIESDLIESVIALPSGVLSHTTVPPAILVINRAKSPERRGQIFFVDASGDVEHTRRASMRKLHHLASIPAIVNEFREHDGYSKSVSIDEVASNGYNLRPGTYFVKSQSGERLDRIAEILQSRVRQDSSSDSPEIPVIQGRDLGVRNLTPDDLARWQPSDLSRAIFVQEGDVLIQRIGDRPKAALANAALDRTLASDTVFIIRLRSEHRARGPYLVGFLNSPAGQKRLASVRTSSVIPSLSIKNVRGLRVPLSDPSLLGLFGRVQGLEDGLYDRFQRVLNLRSRIFEAQDTTSVEAEVRQLSLETEVIKESVERSEDLDFQIRNFYPHMVAYGYRRTSSIFDPEKRYRQLLAVLDALLPFLGSVGLALATSLARPPHLETHQLGREQLTKIWQGGASLGHWAAVCRNSAKLLRDHKDVPASRAFADMWSKRLDKTIGDLIKQRNDNAHRPKVWSKREFESRASSLQSQIEEVIKESLFFVQHPIRLVESISAPWREGVVLNTFSYSGDHPSLRREQIKYQVALTEGHLYLELAPGSWLSLYPLLSVEELGGERRTYTIDKIGEPQRIFLRSLEDGKEVTSAHLDDVGKDFWFWFDSVYKESHVHEA